MNRHTSSAARLVGTLLIVGIVAVACGRQGASQGAQTSAPVPTSAASAVAPTPTPVPTVATSDAPASPNASDSATPAASYSPPAAADDPVTGEIQSIDQLLNGLNGSLSGSNGGE